MIERQCLSDGYEISRLIKGGWHLVGGHGAIDADQAIRDMAAFVEAGITTFDCADIYTGVEELIGTFRRRYPSLGSQTQVHTKFVPDLPLLSCVNRAYVEANIDRSLRRLGTEQLDLVQFHWWDFNVPGYVEAALELDRLRQMGKIAHVGVTNFDTAHLQEIVSAGVRVCAHQLQYSLLDDRPDTEMTPFCQSEGISLLCYGTVAGGFLSDRWLNAPEPAESLANRSLVKYRLIIDEFGGWPLFQDLLRQLDHLARTHQTDIASIATRAILDRPGVVAAIVGATNTAHLLSHQHISALRLTAADRAAMTALTSCRLGPSGDVYTLERDQAGPHGRIMKYDLNEKTT